MQLSDRSYSEKRDFVRMVLDCEVTFMDTLTGEEGVGRGRNLSGRGIMLMVQEPCRPGTQLEIRIDPERSIVPPLHAIAEVVRMEPDEAGGYVLGAAIREILQ